MINSLPMYYDRENVFEWCGNPSGVNVTNTATAAFFRKYYMSEAMSVFSWNFPSFWDGLYFKTALYNGSVCVMDTPQFGVIPQHGTPSGYNVFYNPARYIVANPVFGSKSYDLTIGKDCVVFKMFRDYKGIGDLVSFYADYSALVAQACGVNLINSKLAYAFGARNNTEAETYKSALDDILSGKPAVVVNKKLMTEDGKIAIPFFTQNIKQTYITNELLEAWRTIKNMFCTQIGLPNANVTKKERLTTDEVNVNNAETQSLASMWYEDWQKSVKDVKDMFGVEIGLKWREGVRGNEHVASETVDNGPVSV